MGYARYTVIIALVAAVGYEPLPLDFSKIRDLSAICYVDAAIRIVSAQLLPNPFLSTG
jgi:hypothetical protein